MSSGNDEITTNLLKRLDKLTTVTANWVFSSDPETEANGSCPVCLVKNKGIGLIHKDNCWLMELFVLRSIAREVLHVIGELNNDQV